MGSGLETKTVLRWTKGNERYRISIPHYFLGGRGVLAIFDFPLRLFFGDDEIDPRSFCSKILTKNGQIYTKHI
jgi:hypothetical protein